MLLSSGDFAVYRSHTRVFDRLAPRFGNLASARARRRLLDSWLPSNDFRRSGLDPDEFRRRVMLECRTAGDLLRLMMEGIARRQNASRWAESTPSHLLHIPEIWRDFPDARVIHVVRDGRDVALSLQKQGWIRPLPWDRNERLLVAGIYWSWAVATGRKYGRALGTQYTEVRFEDLVGNPRQILSRLEPFVEHDLDYDRIQANGIGSVSQPNTSFRDTGPSAGFNPVARWRTMLSPAELARLETALQGTLSDLGYHRATDPSDARDPGRLGRMARLYRTYFSIKHWAKRNTPIARILLEPDDAAPGAEPEPAHGGSAG